MTPATKAEEGHDLNITEAEAAALCGAERYAAAREAALGSTRSPRRTRRRGGSSSPTRSSSSASIADGVVTLGDEALTPDSSRFWPGDAYAPGGPQPSFDKQYVRDCCLATGWDRTYPGPELPDDVVAGTRARYVEAFERLTGIPFDALPLRPEGGSVKATVLIRPKARHPRSAGRGRRRGAPHARLRRLRRPCRPARRRRARHRGSGGGARRARPDVARAAREPADRVVHDRAGGRRMSDGPRIAVVTFPGLERRR